MTVQDILIDFARLARRLARYSVCKRRGVGCVILTNESLQCVAWSVNGPAAFEDVNCSGEKDRCGCVHSEVNTLLRASGQLTYEAVHSGCLMICSRAPCVPCATAIVNAGYITRVFLLDESEPGADGVKVLRNCEVQVQWLDVPEDAEVGLRDPNMEPSQPSSARSDKFTQEDASLIVGDLPSSN